MERAAKPKKKRLTKILVLSTILASLGSFQHGYTIWIVHNPKTVLVPNFNSTLSDKILINYDETLRLLLTVTVIMYPVGGLMGSLLLRPMSDNCGRKGALIITNALAVLSSILQGLSRTANLYNFNVFARFVTGIYSGVYAGIVPLYIGEIAPTNLRGSLIVVSVLFLTAGVAVAQVMCLPSVLANKKGLPFLVSFSGVIALFTGPLLFFSPASPRFLFIQKNNKEKAREVFLSRNTTSTHPALQKLRELDDVEDEMEELQEEDLCEAQAKHMTVSKLLNFRPLRYNLICISIVLAGHQLAGVNGAYFYAERTYAALPSIKLRSDIIAIIVVFSLLLVIFFTIFAIDSMGRRILLLMGFLVCNMACILLTLSIELQTKHPSMASFSAFLVISFITGHLIGPASIPYVLAVEFFLQSSRASAFAIGGLVNWIARLLSVMIFLLIEPFIGSYSLLIFWPLCVATFIYCFMNVPETRGKTFVQIHRYMALQSERKSREVETE